MTTAAVSDAGPPIHLAEIGSLELFSIFDTLLIPETVHGEIETGGVPEGLSELSYERIEAEAAKATPEKLDAGERAALAVAKERGVVLLTDDLPARESAAAADVEVHGSIGVIALAYARGTLDKDEAVSHMRGLQRETSLFVTDAVVERGIELLDDGRTDS